MNIFEGIIAHATYQISAGKIESINRNWENGFEEPEEELLLTDF